MSARLIVVLGDQLWLGNPALLAADKKRDTVLMVEAPQESTHVWSHQIRTAVFLSAMRHFAQQLADAGYRVVYLKLGAHRFESLQDAWADQIRNLKPAAVLACEPGEWRVEQALITTCNAQGAAIEILPDTHFLISRAQFAQWAGAKPKQLRMEMFYRHMRKTTGVLMQGDKPEGGQWNYDAENRESFGKQGPQNVPTLPQFKPDAVTQEVLADVKQHFAGHPGALEPFNWPVTRKQALQALKAFVAQRLPRFGQYQDAMWADEPFLFHSLISSALNVRLLDPREVIDAALTAYRAGDVELAATEGFIRQILGWREFMRGVYWLDMPAMRQANHYQCTTPLPKWYWSGKTQMNCMRQAIGQTLQHAYAHHIQRLMVTGNFALIAGLIPQEVCDWYLAVYVDAVEWVELPNTAGMALYANGGRFTTKPYAASGAYIKRMSNYCSGCRYKPDVRSGPGACPVTVFYWDFLMRHEHELGRNQRAALMMKNLARLSDEQREAIRATAIQYTRDLNSL
ncbi:MAG: cryptochrome/photolyase family protein [Burkholderiaceae bacterium]